MFTVIGYDFDKTSQLALRLLLVFWLRLENTPPRTSAALALAIAIWWAEIFAVVVALAWPISLAVVTISTPFAIIVEAAVCRNA